MKHDKKGGILILIGVILFFAGSMFSVVSACHNLSPSEYSISADGNTITINSIGYTTSGPANVPIQQTGVGCLAVPIDLTNKDIKTVSINLAGNFYTSTGPGVGESCNSNVPNPIYTSTNTQGFAFDNTGFSYQLNYYVGTQNYRNAYSFCPSLITSSGTVMLADKPQTTVTNPPAQGGGNPIITPGTNDNQSIINPIKPLTNAGFSPIRLLGVGLILIGFFV